MKSIEISNSVRTLRDQGRSLHEISRLLCLSRNTMRRILRVKAPPVVTAAMDAALQQRLKDVYARAHGNAVRMAQILASDYEMELPYSTLTRWVRQAELRAAPKRSGEYHFAPGEEMQHDTSPHRVMLGGKAVPLQCAALTLAYSQRLYVRYYLRNVAAKDMWRQPPILLPPHGTPELVAAHISTRYSRRMNSIREGSDTPRRAEVGRSVISTLASALAFMSRSTSAYTLVVSSETCPSHARMVLMSTPARSRWTAVICLMTCGLTRFAPKVANRLRASSA